MQTRKISLIAALVLATLTAPGASFLLPCSPASIAYADDGASNPPPPYPVKSYDYTTDTESSVIKSATSESIYAPTTEVSATIITPVTIDAHWTFQVVRVILGINWTSMSIDHPWTVDLHARMQ